MDNVIVKRAADIKSLDELKLSTKAKTYLLRGCKSLEQIIWEGRRTAYMCARYPEVKKRGRKSLVELAQALEEAGYIRKNIGPESFCISLLYQVAYNCYESIICHFDDLCVKDCEVDQDGLAKYTFDYALGNRRYEDFQNPTAEQVDIIKDVMRSCLTYQEYDVITGLLGFDGEVRTLEDVARLHHIRSDEARRAKSIGIRKLSAKNILPVMVMEEF